MHFTCHNEGKFNGVERPMEGEKKNWTQIRRRVSEIIEVGASDDIPSRI